MGYQTKERNLLMYCPHCNTIVAEDQQYCPNCGNNTVPGEPVVYQPVEQTSNGPKPSVSFIDAIKLFFTNYTNFQGRSRRSEYWYASLFNYIVSLALGSIPVVGPVVSLALLIPGIAVAVRRLHDIGKSGWWYLINFLPLIGQIIFIIWCCKDSTEDNQWGPNPKY